jgi:phage-related protein
MFKIDYYELSSGRSPVEEFIEEQERQSKAAIFALLERAKVDPVGVSRHLRGKIYELKARAVDGQFRFLYFYWVEKTLLIVHAFKKKTGRTDPDEIELAEKRMKEHLNRSKK